MGSLRRFGDFLAHIPYFRLADDPGIEEYRSTLRRLWGFIRFRLQISARGSYLEAWRAHGCGLVLVAAFTMPEAAIFLMVR